MTDLEYIKAHPGKYAIELNPALRSYVMVETDEQGNVHQLNPQGQRDGILRDDRWDPHPAFVKCFVVSESHKTWMRVPSNQ